MFLRMSVAKPLHYRFRFVIATPFAGNDTGDPWLVRKRYRKDCNNVLSSASCFGVRSDAFLNGSGSGDAIACVSVKFSKITVFCTKSTFVPKI